MLTQKNLYREIFERIASRLAEVLSVDTSKQSIDSVHIFYKMRHPGGIDKDDGHQYLPDNGVSKPDQGRKTCPGNEDRRHFRHSSHVQRANSKRNRKCSAMVSSVAAPFAA